MISPSTLSNAATLAAAAVDLALDAGKPAAKAAGGARPVPGASKGPLAMAAGSVVSALAKAGPARTSRRASTRRSSSAGYATSTSRATTSKTSTSKAGTSAGDPLSFLKDPKLSIEEKLLRLLSFLNEKWEKEMQQKMDQIAAGEGTAKSSAKKSSSSKKSGGLLGGLGGVIKSALGPAGIALEALKIPAVRTFLSKIGGPVLAAGATALGFPQVAPLLLKHGPKIIELAAGVASSLDGAGEKSSSGSGSTTTTKASGEKLSDAERQRLTLEIQRIYEKQKEMFTLVSNILRVGHDTRMSIVNNVR